MNDSSHPTLVLESPQRLSTKITGLLMLFFVAAVVAIGVTLRVSWQLEGSAAAINDAGSERMRSYLLGLLSRQGIDDADAAEAATAIRFEMERFETVLRGLRQGDPARPMAPPRDKVVFDDLSTIERDWHGEGKPLLESYLSANDADGRRAAAMRYGAWVNGYVGEVDALVRRMEQIYTFNANLLRTVQIALLGLALFATAVLIRFFFVLVVRPLDHLYAGIRRMAGDDFSARLPVETRDEFGVVSAGFNRMAQHLQELYGTLEERVAAKTSCLAERNLELGLLYETTAFLNEPRDIDSLCRGFLKRVKAATRATAGAVRLCSGEGDELFIVAHEGLSSNFVDCEQAIGHGECACGEALARGEAVIVDLRHAGQEITRPDCAAEGMRVTSAFNITHNKQVLGVFNLYFDDERTLGKAEVCLLETLGQHLGVAVENQRLRSRDRELAISEERNLLAQELHDSIAQGLAFLNIQVQLLQDSLDKQRMGEVQGTVDQIREGVKESYEDIRELLVHFRTRVGQADLDSAIRNSLQRFEGQTGIATHLEIVGKRAPLQPDEQVQVMHIVQESLSNIRKHAMASHVDVKVERGAQGVVIAVSDDGVGFTADGQEDASGRHVGLKIMQERARRVGGECTIESEPGHGTRVVLALS